MNKSITKERIEKSKTHFLTCELFAKVGSKNKDSFNLNKEGSLYVRGIKSLESVFNTLSA